MEKLATTARETARNRETLPVGTCLFELYLSDIYIDRYGA